MKTATATSPLPRTRRPASAAARDRERVVEALRACTVREQLALVLLLYERLTPIEAASALGLSPRQVERAYDAALAELRRALGSSRTGRLSRALARRSIALEGRLRRAA